MSENSNDTESKNQTDCNVTVQTGDSAQERYEQDMRAYRVTLVQLEQKNQSDYDKAVMALSGGALGLSFTFLKEVVQTSPVGDGWLLSAWVCWGLSVICVLFSFYTSQQALRQAITEVDESKKPTGGRYNHITAALNLGGGILFLIGVILLVIFVAQNTPSHARKTDTTPAPAKQASRSAPDGETRRPHSSSGTPATSTTTTTTTTVEKIRYGR